MRRLLLPILLLAILLTAAGCGEKKGGDDVSDAKTGTLKFSSFDGGGPEFDYQIADEEIAVCSGRREYRKANHAELDGAGYDVILTVTGKAAGDTELSVSSRASIGDNWDRVYAVHVDEELRVTLTLQSETPYGEELLNLPTSSCMLVLETPTQTCYVAPETCLEALSLISDLSAGPVEAALTREDGGLSVRLPEIYSCSAAAMRTEAGDVLLLADGQTLLFCTAAGEQVGVRIGTMSARYLEALPDADVPSILLWIEWSE